MTTDGSIENVYLNVRTALDMGYKLLDTAVMYGNEEEIGEIFYTVFINPSFNIESIWILEEILSVSVEVWTSLS